MHGRMADPAKKRCASGGGLKCCPSRPPQHLLRSLRGGRPWRARMSSCAQHGGESMRTVRVQLVRAAPLGPLRTISRSGPIERYFRARALPSRHDIIRRMTFGGRLGANVVPARARAAASGVLVALGLLAACQALGSDTSARIPVGSWARLPPGTGTCDRCAQFRLPSDGGAHRALFSERSSKSGGTAGSPEARPAPYRPLRFPAVPTFRDWTRGQVARQCSSAKRVSGLS